MQLLKGVPAYRYIEAKALKIKLTEDVVSDCPDS